MAPAIAPAIRLAVEIPQHCFCVASADKKPHFSGKQRTRNGAPILSVPYMECAELIGCWTLLTFLARVSLNGGLGRHHYEYDSKEYAARIAAAGCGRVSGCCASVCRSDE